MMMSSKAGRTRQQIERKEMYSHHSLSSGQQQLIQTSIELLEHTRSLMRRRRRRRITATNLIEHRSNARKMAGQQELFGNGKQDDNFRQASSPIASLGCIVPANILGLVNFSLPFVIALLALSLAIGVPQLANGIKLQPEGREKFFWSGEQFVITCQNHNNIKNVKIRWLGPSGAFITDDRSQRIHVESNGVHSSRLVVQNATAGLDEGLYKCTIGSSDDRQPRETIEFVLRLLQTTSFKDTPRHSILAASSGPNSAPAIIPCQVEFDPSVLSGTVSWYRNNVPIDMLNDSAIQVLEYDPSKQVSQLQISPLRRDHEGVYQCKAQAVTSRLSKISEHAIELEINYAPSFEPNKQTVWVESGRSVASRQHVAASQQQQHHHTGFRGAQTGEPVARGRGRLGHPKHHQTYTLADSWSSDSQPGAVNQTGTGSVRVELRCSCQANPPASIMWFTSSNFKYVVQKGEPEFVLEQPTLEQDGHNTSSLLVINYSLDPNWPYRHETYTCSASNKLGKATKTYTIEQGDPPPAFNVAPKSKMYNPKTSTLSFTLLGPNFDPADVNQPFQKDDLAQDIVPPVDSFRIRAETPAAGAQATAAPANTAIANAATGTVNQGAGQQPISTAHNYNEMSKTNYLKRHSEPSVTWRLSETNAPDQKLSGNNPRNVTVKLTELPPGNQRLFLEAHNAVGWSPNATYLGDYYIVSGASSLISSCLSMVMITQLLAYHYLANQSSKLLIEHNIGARKH